VLPEDHPLREPISQVQGQIQAEQARLEQLARSRAQLKQKLEDLQRQQIRELLRAAVTPDDDESPAAGALERVLEKKLKDEG
jgi:hypothetical protein